MRLSWVAIYSAPIAWPLTLTIIKSFICNIGRRCCLHVPFRVQCSGMRLTSVALSLMYSPKQQKCYDILGQYPVLLLPHFHEKVRHTSVHHIVLKASGSMLGQDVWTRKSWLRQKWNLKNQANGRDKKVGLSVGVAPAHGSEVEWWHWTLWRLQ